MIFHKLTAAAVTPMFTLSILVTIKRTSGCYSLIRSLAPDLKEFPAPKMHSRESKTETSSEMRERWNKEIENIPELSQEELDAVDGKLSRRVIRWDTRTGKMKKRTMTERSVKRNEQELKEMDKEFRRRELLFRFHAGQVAEYVNPITRKKDDAIVVDWKLTEEAKEIYDERFNDKKHDKSEEEILCELHNEGRIEYDIISVTGNQHHNVNSKHLKLRRSREGQVFDHCKIELTKTMTFEFEDEIGNLVRRKSKKKTQPLRSNMKWLKLKQKRRVLLDRLLITSQRMH